MTVSDGVTDSSDAFQLTVTPANDTPIATNDTFNFAEDSILNPAAPGVLVNDTDADGDSLRALLVTNPTHGSLTLTTNGSFSYTPSANYHAPASSDPPRRA